MIPGAQYAFGTLVVGLFAMVCLSIGVQAGRMVEVREEGEVTNAALCMFTWLFVMFGLMYALSPIMVSLIRWAGTVVKGG